LSVRELLRLLGWLGCAIYSTIPLFWLLIHPRTDFWREREKSPYRVLLPAWMLMWALMAGATWRWRHLALYHSFVSWIPAALLFVTGFLIYICAAKHFTGAQLGGFPQLRPSEHEQRLVTSGIRAHVRHPVYLGHLCEMLAWSIGTGLAVCYALTAFTVLTGAIMIRLEETELEQRFGEAYREYKKRVPAVLPL
jgi:protein-S-isoprenylcysteine O-methyltransferase Ste14